MKSFSADQLEAPTCPLCGPGPAQYVRYNFTPFRVVACAQCELNFLSPRLAEPEMLKLYQDEAYYRSEVAGQGYDEYLELHTNWLRTFTERLRQIRPHKPAGRVLDIGCGPGFFLEAAQAQGYDAYGIDPSEYIVNIAQQKFGGRVRAGLIETAGYDEGSFDLIVAFDTFEHIYDPLKFLAAIRRALKKDGVVAITTPDPTSLLARLSRQGWVSFKLPEHVFYWSPKTIQAALKRSGFVILEMRSAGQYATVSFLLRRLLRLKSNQGGFMRPVFAALSRISLYADNGSLTVIARKKDFA